MRQMEIRTFGAVLVVSAAMTMSACGGDDSESGSASATSIAASASASSAATSTSASGMAGAQLEYSSLLIQPSDVGPGATVKDAPQPLPGGDPGIGAAYSTADGDRVVVVSLPVLADESAAVGMIDAMKQAIAQQIAGSTAEPIDVGSNGFLFQGTRADTSKLGASEISEVVFNQGRVLVNLEIDSAPGNPTSRDIILDLARKQADVIKAALPR